MVSCATITPSPPFIHPSTLSRLHGKVNLYVHTYVRLLTSLLLYSGVVLCNSYMASPQNSATGIVLNSIHYCDGLRLFINKISIYVYSTLPVLNTNFLMPNYYSLTLMNSCTLMFLLNLDLTISQQHTKKTRVLL